LDAAIFQELAQRWPRIGRATIALKAGDYDNELSRYRYDVTLSVGAKYRMAQPDEWIEWDKAGAWQQELRERFARSGEGSIGVRGIPDSRVSSSVAALRMLSPGENNSNASQIQAAA